MANRVVTVFGGSGFIGRHVVKRLAEDGWVVRVAARDLESAMFLKPLGNVGQVTPLAIDASDPAMAALAVDGADAVINLIGILYESGKRTFQRMHVDVAGSIAKAAADAGAKHLIHVSAIGADKTSQSGYARTKALGEEAVLAAFPNAVILRPSVVFGSDDNFFNMFAGMTRISPFLPVFGCPLLPTLKRTEGGGFSLDIYGGGGTKFQPVFVGDVADAAMAGLRDPNARGKTFELGGPRAISFKEVMDIILANIGRKRLILPIPFFVGAMQATILGLMPKPLLTRDQVTLLKRDNVVAAGALTLADLGVEATPVESVVPKYLSRYSPPRAKGILAA